MVRWFFASDPRLSWSNEGQSFIHLSTASRLVHFWLLLHWMYSTNETTLWCLFFPLRCLFWWWLDFSSELSQRVIVSAMALFYLWTLVFRSIIWYMFVVVCIYSPLIVWNLISWCANLISTFILYVFYPCDWPSQLSLSNKTSWLTSVSLSATKHSSPFSCRMLCVCASCRAKWNLPLNVI